MMYRKINKADNLKVILIITLKADNTNCCSKPLLLGSKMALSIAYHSVVNCLFLGHFELGTKMLDNYRILACFHRKLIE